MQRSGGSKAPPLTWQRIIIRGHVQDLAHAQPLANLLKGVNAMVPPAPGRGGEGRAKEGRGLARQYRLIPTSTNRNRSDGAVPVCRQGALRRTVWLAVQAAQRSPADRNRPPKAAFGDCSAALQVLDDNPYRPATSSLPNSLQTRPQTRSNRFVFIEVGIMCQSASLCSGC